MFKKVNHQYILDTKCRIMPYWLLASNVANAAGPFTTSGAEGLAVLFYIFLAIGIAYFLVFVLLLYFSFFAISVKVKKVSRVFLGLFFIPLGLTISSIYFTPNYPDVQNNLPEGKNYEEVTMFKNRVISRKNGEVIIIPHDYYYPDETRFLFSDNYKTTENGEKIYEVDIAYIRNMYDFYREQPEKFPQRHGTNQFKFTIPIFPITVDKYKFVNNKMAYLIVANEPNTKRIFGEDRNAKRALKAIEDILDRPRKADFEEFLAVIDLMFKLDSNWQIPVKVIIKNLGWKKRTDVLIKKGVDLNGMWEIPGRKDWSYSPLLWAVSHDHKFDEVEYLIEAGADPHKKNSHGKSPYEELKNRLKTKNDIGKFYSSKAEELVQLMKK